MALSEQKTPTGDLLKFLAYVAAAGYHVGEHPAYGGVDGGVHRAGSWHGDGLAADINWRGGGSERSKLVDLIPVAESFGLAITFARDGVEGSARTHQGHLHVDVGEWSNYGDGAVRAVGPRPSQQPKPATAKDWNMDRIDLRNAKRTRVRGRHMDNLQGLLMAAGYGPRGLVGKSGRPDGIGGPGTRSALGKFQVKHNVGDGKGKADYVAGDATWKKLIEK